MLQVQSVLLWRVLTMNKQHVVHQLHQRLNPQAGFTLIELMISIVLGLLVVAAALAVFLSGQRSLAVQTGMSELQQNSVFGLTRLTHDLRHLNLNTTGEKQVVKPAVAGSGIIFDTTNHAVAGVDGYKTKVTTQKATMNKDSDQLTIQYKTQTKSMENCEGETLAEGEVNVQRYYIDDLPEATYGKNRYALYCDAIKSGLGTKAQVIIQDVEAFKVRFAVKDTKGTLKTDDDTIRYRTLAQLNVAPLLISESIVAIEVGVVARSGNAVGADKIVDDTKEYHIAGETVKLATASAGTKYLRESFSQVVAIRNGQGGE